MIVFEDGITSAAYVSDPEVQIEIVELDRNYLSSEQREQVYTALSQDSALHTSDYNLSVPGYEDTMKEAE